MARVLTAARVQVPPDDEAEYMRLVSEQASDFAQRGCHLWVFRGRHESGAFLEFREGPGPSLAWMEGGTDTIRRRDEDLRRLVHYSGDELVWDEVILGR